MRSYPQSTNCDGKQKCQQLGKAEDEYNQELAEKAGCGRLGLSVDSTACDSDVEGVGGGRKSRARAQEKRMSTVEQGSTETKWYSVFPEHGTLLPGEKLEIKFLLLVRKPLSAGCVTVDVVCIIVKGGGAAQGGTTGGYASVRFSVYGATRDEPSMR